MKVEKEGVTRYILTAKKKERGTVTGGANFVGWTGGKREEVDASEPPLFFRPAYEVGSPLSFFSSYPPPAKQP